MTIPTKEQALAALDELFPTGDIAEKHIKTLRTYIEGEKDSLGADEALNDIDRDWAEDFAHENGMYSNKCVKCRRLFLGHKRRALCKVCDESASAHVTGLDRKFSLGDMVTKTKGSKWTGRVVGFYSTDLTPIGYAVESGTETGSVQIYPEAALAILDQQDAPDVIEQCVRQNNELVHVTLADLRAKVEGMKELLSYDVASTAEEGVNMGFNAALDAVIALIDGE